MINEQELDAKLRNEEMIFITCSVSERWNVLLLVMNVTKGSLPKKKTTEIVKLVLPLLTPPPPPVIGKKNVGIVV